MPGTPNHVTVPVKSAWASKVNWAAAVTIVGTAATGLVGVFNLDPATAAKLTAAIALAGNVATIILRTFFSGSVTVSSAPK